MYSSSSASRIERIVILRAVLRVDRERPSTKTTGARAPRSSKQSSTSSQATASTEPVRSATHEAEEVVAVAARAPLALADGEHGGDRVALGRGRGRSVRTSGTAAGSGLRAGLQGFDLTLDRSSISN